MIDKTILHYEILEKLGEGGMGVVYKAEDTKLKRNVAIKFLPKHISTDSNERERFKIEAQAAAALSHPNIATIYAIEEHDDEMFIVMEYIEGRELKEIIQSETPNLQSAIDHAIQIAEGLQAAHKKGIVHRDIKSSNIMVTDEGKIKIMDFGLAKIGKGMNLTKSGTTLGTILYMPPEQLRNKEVDNRSDIWSFGVVLYEMLTGELPFKGDYEQAVLYSILNEEPAPPSQILNRASKEIDNLVIKSLAKNPKERYQGMEEVIADLKSLKDETIAASQKARHNSTMKKLPGLAVLPFASIKSDPEMDFLGFALADQIISALTYIKSVSVRPSSAVRKYQNQSVDAPTAGKDLQVNFILTGYYLKEADTVRLNVELVNTQSNEMVWRESIEVKYENTFKLQDIVSEKVLHGLKVQFSQDERDRMQADVPKDALAYEYYLRAISYPITLEGDQLAIEMLKKSIKLDSSYAPAYSELGFRIGHTANSAMLGNKEHRKAEDAFRKALSLNKNLLTTLWYLSLHYTEIGKSEEAAELINQMFRVTPNNAMAHYALGYLYRYTGMLEESAHEVEKALALEPKNQRFLSAGFTYVYLGNYRKAYEVFDLDPENTLSIAWKGMTLFLLDEREQAIEYFDRVIAMEPEGYIGLRHAGVRAYIMGKTQEGLRSIRRLEETNPSDSDSEHWYLIGNAYSLLGDRIACIRTLRKAVEGGFFNYPGMLKDPLLDPVRDDSEFQKVLTIAKEKHETFKKKFFPERQ